MRKHPGILRLYSSGNGSAAWIETTFRIHPETDLPAWTETAARIHPERDLPACTETVFRIHPETDLLTGTNSGNKEKENEIL